MNNNNPFLSKHNVKTKSSFSTPIKNKLNIDNLEMFPDLQINKQHTDSLTNTAINFKTILNTKVPNIVDEEPDIILPGWVKLSRKQNNIIYDYGKTKETKKLGFGIKNVNVNIDIDIDMDQIILHMEDNWYKYEYNYDQIHGEGAYAYKYKIPPVYGPEYDTETETDIDESEFILSDEDENIYNDADIFD